MAVKDKVGIIGGKIVQQGTNTTWKDIVTQAFAQNIDISSGRIDFNYTGVTIDFAVNARYPEEPLCMAFQMQHDYKFGTQMYPHLHWIQNSSDIPNWMIAYRVSQNGIAIPDAFNLAKHNGGGAVYTYSSGTILQIVRFPVISGVHDLSFSIDIKLYRDTANASGLFAGADPYTGIASVKFFDLHYEVDDLGSAAEYIK